MRKCANCCLFWNSLCPFSIIHFPIANFTQICDVPIQIRNDPRVPNEKLRIPSPLGLEIRVRATAEGFWVRIARGELFACLAKKAAQGLKALGHYSCECVQIEGIISSAALIEARNDWKRTGKSKTGIDVNIYGHPHVAKSVRPTAL